MLTTQQKIDIAHSLGGINAFYGLRARPADIGSIPSGQSAIFTAEQGLKLFPNLSDKACVRHGVVAYPQELDPELANSYELVELSIEQEMEKKAIKVVVGCDDPICDELAQLLAKEIYQANGEAGLDWLAYDHEYTMRQAVKNLDIFKERKTYPDRFDVYKQALSELKPEWVIDKLQAM